MKENNKLTSIYLSEIFLENDDGIKQLLNYISTNFKENVEETIKMFVDENLIDLKRHGNIVFKFFCNNNYLDSIKLILNNSNFNPSANDNEAIAFASEKVMQKL